MTPPFVVERKNKFFEAIRSVAEFELRPGPTVTFLSEVDLTQIESIRRGATGTRPSYTAFVAKAVAQALREFPYANRRVCRPPSLLWMGTRLLAFHRRDIAIASERDIPGAESVAFYDVFRDVDRRSLPELTEALRALAASDESTNAQWRTFRGLITRFPSALAKWVIRLPYYFPRLWVKYRGAAVLISSPSKYGVDAVFAAQSFPLSAAFGLVKQRPVVRDGAIVARPTFLLTLNFDRRVMAGAQGARFFKRIVELLENPDPLTTAQPEQAT